MHTRAASRLSVVALLASLALAAGCTHSGDSPDRPETGDSPAASAPVSPDESDAPSATPPASTSTGKPLLDRLLPTDLVPGLNSEWHWQDGDTGTPPVDPFGRCAKADLLSIGATEAVERTYFPPDDSDDNAAEQIAEFPDASTAARAWSVLGAWHKRCGKVADAPRVGEMVSVPVCLRRQVRRRRLYQHRQLRRHHRRHPMPLPRQPRRVGNRQHLFASNPSRAFRVRDCASARASKTHVAGMTCAVPMMAA